MSTTEEKEFKIDIDTLFPEFNDHLNIHQNSRIFFSGKFGTGKTYFLDKFFENKKDEYTVFHLFPINYQISSNENIIGFLKYDILVELLNKKDIFNDDQDLDKSFIDFIKEEWNSSSVINWIIENTIDLLPWDLGKLGKPLKTALEIDKKFQEFKQSWEKDTIRKFLETHNSESDVISEIIKSKIKRYTNSILILDDLDRIDPEHIFRILNIFSTHFDQNSNQLTNKFGFDKVILVGDIHNIKSIFHHKYWNSSDFNGYFDKFFSIEVFQFKNETILVNIIDAMFDNFQIEYKDLFKEMLSKSGYLKIFLEDILLKSLKLKWHKKMNLRQLLKPIKYRLNTLQCNPHEHRSGGDSGIIESINLGIKILISIFGWLNSNLLEILEEIQKELKIENDRKDIYKVFSESILSKISPFNKTSENLLLWWSNYSITIKNGKIESVKVSNSTDKTSIEYLFFDLLIEYIKHYH